MTLVTEAAPQEPARPPKPRWRARALVLLAALVLVGGVAFAAQRVFAADAHDHGSHSHTPHLDPCTLVTEAQAERIVGPVLEPREGGLGVVSDQVVCQMNLERDARWSANIGFADFDAEAKYRGFATRFPGVSEEVEGLGDEAVWIDVFRLVLVRVDDELITVQHSDVVTDPAVVKDQAIHLARLAAEARG